MMTSTSDTMPLLQIRAMKANTEEAAAALINQLEADTGIEVCSVIVRRDDNGRIAVAISAEV